MVMIDVGTPKMARERLCRLQSILHLHSYDELNDGGWIEKMIDQLDVHRPLGPDGKHGNLHTATCGCELDEYDEYVVDVHLVTKEYFQVELTTWNTGGVTKRMRSRPTLTALWSGWEDQE